jgi:WD40 repeat protein/DNA-binding SARP family transcriptional activator
VAATAALAIVTASVCIRLGCDNIDASFCVETNGFHHRSRRLQRRFAGITGVVTGLGDPLEAADNRPMSGRIDQDVQRLEFRLLGPLEVWRKGEIIRLGGERQRALLALLLLHANELVTTDRLVDQLFGGDASDRTVNALRVAVSRLRRLLDDGEDNGVVLTRAGGYLLRALPEQVDVTLFERGIDDGQRLLTAGDAAAASAKLREALALYRGPVLGDLSLLEFVQPVARRLDELRLAALMARFDADLSLGHDAELVGELERLIAEHPLQERLRQQLMLALYRSGRQADALEVYRQTRVLLHEELGLEPSKSLQQLEQLILRQDASLDVHRAVRREPRAAVCPFKGLASFDRADADYFCGRELVIANLVTRLATNTLVGLIGPSGIGKSSVLRAGVLPALQGGVLPGSDRWPQFVFRPGAHPCDELRPALGAEGERIVLAVDQFEEVFTVCSDDAERSAFIDELVRAAAEVDRRALVIVSLRVDFYGRCASYPGFRELLSGAHALIGPMDRGELRRAIEEPAQRAGLEIERPLVDALVADLEHEPGALPLLSTMLLELWSTREGDILRHSAYRATGGVQGAVARLAEAAYAQLDDGHQGIARRLFLRLASGSGETLSRKRVSPEELGGEDDAAVRRVLDRLVASRLLTISDGAVEVAHEALLFEWPRLRGWLDDDAQARRLREHLSAAAREWDSSGRDTGELYRGARLSSALDWAGEHEAELSQVERDFLADSRAAGELEAERERRTNRRLRGLLFGAFSLLALALLAGALALVAREHAKDAEAVAVAQRLGAQALVAKQLDLSLLLARQGVALAGSPVTEHNLEAALAQSPAAIRVFHPLSGRLVDVEASRDGRWLLVTNNALRLAVVDTSTYRTRRVISGDAGFFADDGRIVVQRDDRYSLVDPQTGAVSSFDLRLDVDALLFSISSDLAFAAGSHISGRPEREVTVWSLQGRQHVLHRMTGHPGLQVAEVGVSSDRLFVFESSNRTGLNPLQLRSALLGRVTVEVWSLRPWRRLADLSLSEALGHGLAPWTVDRQGRLAAFGEADGTVTVVDLMTGSSRKLGGRHAGNVIGLGFAPDGRTIVSTGDDDEVLAWDVKTGALRETLSGHASRVFGPAFSHDGGTLYTVDLTGEAIAWDLDGSRRFGPRFRAGSGNLDPESDIDGAVARFALSPDGRRIATTESNGRTAVVDRVTRRQLFETPPARGGRALDVAWSPDGRTFVTVGAFGDVQSWHADDGSRAVSYHGLFGQNAHAVAINPQGTVVAAASDGGYGGGYVYLWDARTGKPLGSALHTGAPAYDLAFSPDGKELAAAVLGDGVADVWRLPSRRVAFVVIIDDEFNRGDAVAFSPDGRLLATGGGSGLVRFWDARTGKQVGGSLLASPGYVLSIGFAPDGKLLVTAGTDGATRLWNVRGRTPVGSPLPITRNISAESTFAPSGDGIVTVYANGQAFSYDLRPSSWERRACAVAGRILTRAEWAQYLPGRPYRPACA